MEAIAGHLWTGEPKLRLTFVLRKTTMLRKHVFAISLQLIAVTLCQTTSIHLAHAQDVRAPRETPEVQRLAASYYVDKYRVDIEEAQHRLAIQDQAAGIDDELTHLLGDQYAGIWYDHSDGGRLKIGLTRRAEGRADRVGALVDRYGLAADADIVSVRYSIAELETRQHEIQRRLAEMIESAHAQTSYDTRSNKVVVTAPSALPPREEARLGDISVLPEVIIRRVEVPSLASEPVTCEIGSCNPPLRGGREMINPDWICTLAFVARDRVHPDRLWALTAGHCIYPNETLWSARDEMGRVALFGTIAYYTYADTSGSGADVGIVSINGPCLFCYWFYPPPIPAVIVKSSNQTAYNPSYAIYATSFSSLGQILCRTGRTTGTECGEVSSLGADETEYISGTYYHLRNMGELDVCGAQGGDSGSPLYKRGKAYGVLSAVHRFGSVSCFEVYQGVRGAESVMGVDVLLTQ